MLFEMGGASRIFRVVLFCDDRGGIAFSTECKTLLKELTSSS